MQQPSQQPGFTAHGPEYHQRDHEQGSAGNPGIELTAGGAACPGAMEGCRNGIYRFSRKEERPVPAPHSPPSLALTGHAASPAFEEQLPEAGTESLEPAPLSPHAPCLASWEPRSSAGSRLP